MHIDQMCVCVRWFSLEGKPIEFHWNWLLFEKIGSKMFPKCSEMEISILMMWADSGRQSATPNQKWFDKKLQS